MDKRPLSLSLFATLFNSSSENSLRRPNLSLLRPSWKTKKKYKSKRETWQQQQKKLSPTSAHGRLGVVSPPKGMEMYLYMTMTPFEILSLLFYKQPAADNSPGVS